MVKRRIEVRNYLFQVSTTSTEVVRFVWNENNCTLILLPLLMARVK